MTQTQVEDIRAFWNERADLGLHAGSNDVIAKRLEIDAISRYVKDGMHILDVGCGNGVTALELARRFKIRIVGADYASRMIDEADAALAAEDDLADRVSFCVADACELPSHLGTFDLIYGERVLINLPDWNAQLSALNSFSQLLRPGGCYVMCECSQTGLDKINELRGCVALPAISPPWHNRYLLDHEVAAAKCDGLTLEETYDFSSTYYFLSRVVNACQAREAGHDPEYNAPINQLALQLPSFGEIGQAKIWLWRKS